jgi:hypothetical protein
MNKEAKDMNRLLWDANARSRLSLSYLTSLKVSTIVLVLLIIVSHGEIILKNKGAVNNHQFYLMAFSLAILPGTLYCIAQLKRIMMISNEPKEKC